MNKLRTTLLMFVALELRAAHSQLSPVISTVSPQTPKRSFLDQNTSVHNASFRAKRAADLLIAFQGVAWLSNMVATLTTNVAIRAEDPPFNARPGIDNTTNLQAALNALTGRQGTITLTSPGRYFVRSTAANPFHNVRDYALILSNNNIALELGPGVWIGPADNIVTNRALSTILVANVTNTAIIGVGTISGNATAQTKATVHYSQGESGMAIEAYNAEKFVVAGNLLEDCFSNPVNIEVGRDIVFSQFEARNCGEGPQIVRATNVSMRGVTMGDPKNVCVGDGLELAYCLNGDVVGCQVNGTNKLVGSALDLFGSRNIFVTDCTFQWPYGISIHDTFETPPLGLADKIAISNCVAELPRSYVGIENFGIEVGGGGDYLISDCQFIGGQNGAYSNTNFTGRVIFEDCSFFPVSMGWQIAGGGIFSALGGTITGSTNGWGILVYSSNIPAIASNGPTLNLVGLTISSNTAGPIRIDGQSTSNYTVRGNLQLNLVGNGNGNLVSVANTLTKWNFLVPLELRILNLIESSIRFTVECSTNVSFTIQSSMDLVTWQWLLTTNSANGVYEFTENGTEAKRFYRALYNL